MVNQVTRNYIEETAPNAVIFTNPSFDCSIIGLTENGSVVYSYDEMVKELMFDDGLTMEEAAEFIDYNTLRTLPYIEEQVRPVIIFNTFDIKEISK